MSTFVLVPGAGGDAWYWHRVVPELAARGHDAVPVDLPAGDPRAGLEDYVDAVVTADRRRCNVLAPLAEELQPGVSLRAMPRIPRRAVRALRSDKERKVGDDRRAGSSGHAAVEVAEE